MDEQLLKPCATCGAPPQVINYGLVVVQCSRKASLGDSNCRNGCGATVEEAAARWNALPAQELVVSEPLSELAARMLGRQGSRRRPRGTGRIPPHE